VNELLLHRRAARYRERLPEDLKASLDAKLESLREDPLGYSGSIRMSGKWSGYRRFRHGDFRVIYAFRPEENRVYVNYIGPRGDIYKK